jgi:hypothetical protein
MEKDRIVKKPDPEPEEKSLKMSKALSIKKQPAISTLSVDEKLSSQELCYFSLGDCNNKVFTKVEGQFNTLIY